MIYPVPKPVRAKRTRAPLRNKKRMKKINAKRKGSSFPKRRNYKFQAWVRENAPCIIRNRARALGSDNTGHAVEIHGCNSPVRCCHIVNQARGGFDLGNIFGGCDRAHDAQHQAGSVEAFNAEWRVNCQSEADALTYAFVISGGSSTPHT